MKPKNSDAMRIAFRLMGFPLLYSGVAVLAGGAFCHFTPNWLLAAGLAMVVTGAVSLFLFIKYNGGAKKS